MQWPDLIERLITDNGGAASLSFLYENAGKYRELPRGDWQKTLRGVLYREVRKGRFIKVGLGVYGLPGFPLQKSAYAVASGEADPVAFIGNVSDPHSTIEGMLIELGNFYDFLTYTCDKNKAFDGKNLSSIERLHDVPAFTYAELVTSARRADVIWFAQRAAHIFPKYVYEVEHSTDFVSSMFKMFQLRDFDAKFVLASLEDRKRMFALRIGQEPFYQIRHRFAFRSFETVSQLYFSAVKHFQLQSEFFD